MALEYLRRAAADRKAHNPVFVLVAPYLAPATRDRIAHAGGSYVDTTGNVHLINSRPGLFLLDRGADRDPWRGPGRPRGTLQGPPAASVVRALIDFAPPYSVPEIAARARASTGATYRVVNFLEEEQLVEREYRCPLTTVHWRSIVDRWSRDYGFAQSNTVATFLEPRGLSALTTRLLNEPQLEYAITGSLAVEAVAAYAPARLAMLYVRDISTAAEMLKLRPATAGANVALAAGSYDVVFDRVRLVDGLRLAALSQVAVDLLSGPGRNPNEAVSLLDWMGSRMSKPGDAEVLVAGRRALLDALDALADQRSALVLIGAQAIYLHTGAAPVALAEMTKDTDLAIDPRALQHDPLLEEAMRRAGFSLSLVPPTARELAFARRYTSRPDDTGPARLTPAAAAAAASRRTVTAPPAARPASKRCSSITHR